MEREFEKTVSNADLKKAKGDQRLVLVGFGVPAACGIGFGLLDERLNLTGLPPGTLLFVGVLLVLFTFAAHSANGDTYRIVSFAVSIMKDTGWFLLLPESGRNKIKGFPFECPVQAQKFFRFHDPEFNYYLKGPGFDREWMLLGVQMKGAFALAMTPVDPGSLDLSFYIGPHGEKTGPYISTMRTIPFPEIDAPVKTGNIVEFRKIYPAIKRPVQLLHRSGVEICLIDGFIMSHSFAFAPGLRERKIMRRISLLARAIERVSERGPVL